MLHRSLEELKCIFSNRGLLLAGISFDSRDILIGDQRLGGLSHTSGVTKIYTEKARGKKSEGSRRESG